MKNNEELLEWIDRYNSGSMEEPERSRFLELLERDPSLRVYVDIDQSINKMLKQDDLFEFLEKVKEVSDRPARNQGVGRLLLIAASLLLLVSIGVITLVTVDSGAIGHRLSEVIELKPSSRPLSLSLYVLNESRLCKDISPVTRREMARRNLLAASFKPLAEYELLVGGMPRSENFQLITPEVRISVHRKSVVPFRWKTGTEWSPLELEVINNKGVVVLTQSPVLGNSFTLNTGCFGPGLFYWRITSDDGLILMGSMILF